MLQISTKFSFATLIFLFIGLSSFAQDRKLLVPYRDGKLWGYADTSMQIIIKPQFDDAKFFKDEDNLYYAKGIQQGKPIIIMEDGSVMPDESNSFELPFGIYTSEDYQIEGITDPKLTKGGKHGYSIKGDKYYMAPVYLGFSGFLNNKKLSLMTLKATEKTGIVDPSGNIVIPFEYDQIFVLNDEKNFLATQKDSKWQIINLQKQPVVKDAFEDFSPITDNGLFLVKQNGLFGYINKEAKLVIPLKYTDAGEFGNDQLGFARVKLDGIDFYIDAKGREFVSK